MRWTKLRKILEEDRLCESLRGRVQYFLTHYHNAPDQYGRFCIRVDGKECFFANPYNEKYCFEAYTKIKQEFQIPSREWNDHGHFEFDEENRWAEDAAAARMITENKADVWQVMDAISEYLQLDIQAALRSENELVRLFAVLDRRVGKRTLERLEEELEQQPEWLRFFYHLRLDAETEK